jgi:hypothetical protein
MDTPNFEQNEQNDRKIESVYSTRIRAGKRRTYFFDVRATRANDYFLTITESRKRFDNNGYDRHKIFLYKEDFNKFLKAITEALDYVKTELMPDFDFDAFNHEGDGEEYNPDANKNYAANTGVDASIVNEVEASVNETLNHIPNPTSNHTPVDAPAELASAVAENIVPAVAENIVPEVADDHNDADIVVAEAKQLEARETHASKGDNLSNEEVDKW